MASTVRGMTVVGRVRDLLEAPSTQAQVQGLKALVNVARAGNVSAILHCEVVQTVVELLSSEDDFVVEFACKGMQALTPYEACREVFMNVDGVLPTVQLMQMHPNPVVVVQAMRLLTQLSELSAPRCISMLIPLDILRDLVRHLQSRDDAVRIQAAWTLAAVFADQTLRSQASKHKIEEVLERMRDEEEISVRAVARKALAALREQSSQPVSSSSAICSEKPPPSAVVFESWSPKEREKKISSDYTRPVVSNRSLPSGVSHHFENLTLEPKTSPKEIFLTPANAEAVPQEPTAVDAVHLPLSSNTSETVPQPAKPSNLPSTISPQNQIISSSHDNRQLQSKISKLVLQVKSADPLEAARVLISLIESDDNHASFYDGGGVSGLVSLLTHENPSANALGMKMLLLLLTKSSDCSLVSNLKTRSLEEALAHLKSAGQGNATILAAIDKSTVLLDGFQ